MSIRRIAITNQSAWLFTHADAIGSLPANDFVVRRASFADYMPIREYEGTVRGLIEVGKFFVLDTDEGPVTSGKVVRIVNVDDVPIKEPKPGYITIDPRWDGLTWLLAELRDREGLRQVGHNADILVALRDMGRITDADIRDAQARLKA